MAEVKIRQSELLKATADIFADTIPMGLRVRPDSMNKTIFLTVLAFCSLPSPWLPALAVLLQSVLVLTFLLASAALYFYS